MITLQIIINFIMYVVANTVGEMVYFILGNFKYNVRKVIFWYCVMTAALSVVKFIVPLNTMLEMAVIVINNVALFLFFFLTSDLKILKFFVAYVINVLMVFIGLTIMINMNIDVNAQNDTIDYFYIYVFVFIWCSYGNIVVYYLNKRFHIHEVTMDFDKIYAITFFIYVWVCIFTQAYVFASARIDYIKYESKIYWLYPFSYIFVFALVIMVVAKKIAYDNEIKNELYNQAMIKEQENYERIVKQNERIAKLRHDYVNNLNVVENCCQQENVEKAVELIDRMINEYRIGL